MITVSSLKKVYNRKVAVNIPLLEFRKSELIGLVGNNGAGKTTLFRLMLDLVRADEGKVAIGDYIVSENDQWKGFTAAYLDEGFLIPYLTPYEYFYFVGKLHGLSKKEVDDFIVTLEVFFDGGISKKTYIRDLSRGNQFKVGIAACLLYNPQLLILDEPFANLDPSSQIRLKNMLAKINAEKGTTIVISSHDLNHITDLCKRIILLEKGEIIKDIHTSTDTLQELEEYFKI
ncbi:MAG: ABC transporter ATP-binding protein [Chitinophagaceae bacterium]